MEDAIEYELIMDIANDVCKALGWSDIDRTKSQKNGFIRLLLEKREKLINSLKDVSPLFNTEKFDKYIYSDSFFHLN